MKRLFAAIGFVLALLPMWSSATDVDPDAPVMRIRKGFAINVARYDEKQKLFFIIIVKEPAVGPNYATLESLWSAIEMEGPSADFFKRKDDIIGTEFILKKDLKLAPEPKLIRPPKKKGT